MIYLDNNATTKPFPEVLESMNDFMASRYWSETSPYGQVDGLEEVVENAKQEICKLVGCSPEDNVIFTSGATEANSWAISEGVRRVKAGGWVLSSEIEHPSVSETVDYFQTQGLPVRRVPVIKDGTIDLNVLEEIVDSNLVFATLIFAHNETGVIQPIKEAANLIRKKAPGCLIHTDATQAIGKMYFCCSDDFNEVDLISFSGHKFHGPKGIGGLVVRNGIEDIQPLIRGGGQQNNLRSGTLNIPSIAGIGVAAKKNFDLLKGNDLESLRNIRDHFESCLRSNFPEVYVLGAHAERLANTSFFGIPNTEADDLVYSLAAEGIAVSKGSACTSYSVEPSRMALLMGCDYGLASSLIRFSASWATTFEDITRLLDKLKSVQNLQKL